MPTVTLNDIELYYEQHGQGPDLVLIAGYTANCLTWESILGSLAEQFRVTIFDNRGAGRSSVAKIDSLEQMAEDTALLMQHLDITNAFVLGHSMGGMILQVLMVNYPHLVQKGILAGTRILDNGAYNLHAQVNVEMVQQGISMQTLVRNILTFLFGGHYLTQPGNVERAENLLLQNPYPCTPEGMQNQLAASKVFKRFDWLGKVEQPLLALYGEEDILAVPKNLEVIEGRAQNAQCTSVPACGHMFQFEQPELFVQHIKEFCQ